MFHVAQGREARLLGQSLIRGLQKVVEFPLSWGGDPVLDLGSPASQGPFIHPEYMIFLFFFNLIIHPPAVFTDREQPFSCMFKSPTLDYTDYKSRETRDSLLGE